MVALGHKYKFCFNDGFKKDTDAEKILNWAKREARVDMKLKGQKMFLLH